MNKPKYIIREKEHSNSYFLGYMRGYTYNVENAYRYSEEEILENLEFDPDWCLDVIIKQVYGE